MKPIKIAFLWHQHQPYYKNPDTDVYILPWVRLHGLKDYYDMVEILDDFPKIHQNFNLVPSLLLQLEDYVQNDAKDEILRKTEIPAAQLSEEDRLFLLKYFFMANPERLILPNPGYKRLFLKRRKNLSETGLKQALRFFTNQDLLDLQVWYNLSWTGESHKNQEPFKSLIQKDYNFSEEDKSTLLENQKLVLAKILKKHKDLAEKGQIELSTTPFYHPIVPLLCDTQIARVAMPKVSLPTPGFKFPEDADRQIRDGLDYFEQRFGFKPKGMWPSEGSVSPKASSLFAKNGIQWIATDEEILFQSLALDKLPAENRFRTLYRAYELTTSEGPIHYFFRDHTLSDLIGFVYQKWDAPSAARDFVKRILEIRQQIIKTGGSAALKSAVVSIILDGENCWEFYPENGRPFLKALYTEISRQEDIQSVTFSEFLAQHPKITPLKTIFPGSWINHNFAVWIGHPEDNKAWQFLSKTRNTLQKAKNDGLPDDKYEEAYREIMIAEGSDWFWWFGDDHHTENAAEFDALFRAHLIKIYELLQKDNPPELYEPIHHEKIEAIRFKKPQGFIHPDLDGTYSNYFEWLGAGVFEAIPAGSSMHMVSTLISKILFGFDLENLFFRIEPKIKLSEESFVSHSIIFEILKPERFRITFKGEDLRQKIFQEPIFKRVDSKWIQTEFMAIGAYKDFIEAQIPFHALGVTPGNEIGFRVRILKGDEPVEEWPERNLIEVTVPDQDFESEDWLV